MEGQPIDKIVVEDDLNPELRAQVEAFAKEDRAQAEGQPNIETVPNPDVPVSGKPAEHEPVKPLNPTGEQENAPTQQAQEDGRDSQVPAEGSQESPEGQESQAGVDGLQDFLASSKLSEQELLNKLTESPDAKITVRMKGKDRELTYSDIRSAVGREESFQKKHDLMTKSDEQKLGTLMVAAQGGDKSAQKKVQKMLQTMTGAEDGMELDEKLEDVSDEFDESAILKDNEEKAAWSDSFADVENEVDYQENLDIVQTDLKARVPAKVFDTFWEMPHTRRTMYDLVALGRLDELMDVFDQNLEKFSFEKRHEIKNDPDQWGSLFAETVREQNAQLKQKTNTAPTPQTADLGSPPSPSAMDSVSSGNTGRNPAKAQEGAPDFINMSPEELDKWKLDHGMRLR